MKNRRLLVVLATAACTMLLAAGCGNDDDQPAAPTPGNGADLEELRAVVAAATGEVEFPDLPAGPPAAEGKRIVVISVDQQLEGIVRQVNGVEDAARLIGWDVTVIDGRSNPDTWTSAIERAVNERVDGIIVAAFDVAFVAGAAQQARNAGIPIVGITSGSQVGDDGVFAEIGSVEYNREMGRSQGRFAVVDSDGTAQAIVFNDTSFATAPPIADGAIEVLEQCEGCSVLTKVDFTGAEITTRLSEAVRTALARNPSADYVIVPYDFAAVFAVQGVRDAGASERVKVLSTGGNLANLDLIRNEDIQVMASAQPLEYFGFLAVDAMNRAFNDEPPIPFDAPHKILVRDNLPPPGEPWVGDTDFVSQFRTLWGR